MSLFKQFKSTLAVVDKETSDILTFDALMSVTYTGNAQLTDHPVEGVTDITDHIRRLPKEIQLRGIVSNHPAILLATFRADPSVPGTDPATRAEAAFQFLERVKDEGQLVHLITAGQMFDYTNLAISSLSVTRDKDTSNIVDISLTLREMLIAVTEKVAAPSVVNDKKPKDKGHQPPQPATPAVESDSSALFNAISSAFGG